MKGADGLALRLLRADTPAYSRQGILPFQGLHCAGHVVLSDGLDELRNIDRHGAAAGARPFRALDTTARLGHSLFGTVTEGNLVKVLGADLRPCRGIGSRLRLSFGISELPVLGGPSCRQLFLPRLDREFLFVEIDALAVH